MMSSTEAHRPALALIAHNARKQSLVSFAVRHRATLCKYRLIATGTTGGLLQEALQAPIECKLSGPLGGDAEIATEVVHGRVQALFFFVDPLSAQAHEADIQGLLRLCNVHDVAVATNHASATLMVRALSASGRRRSGHPHPSARTSGVHAIGSAVQAARSGGSGGEQGLVHPSPEPHCSSLATGQPG